MKKRIISLVLVIVLALSLCVPAMAASTTEKVAITYRAIKINLNGKEITPCDAAGNTVEPFIMNSNGTTYLPLRAIGQALGLNVKWDGAANTVTLTSGGEVKTGAGAAGTTTGSKNVAITYRNIKVFLDGKQLELVNTKGEKVEPFILNSNSSVYLPLRVVGEALGLEVGWDSKTSTAILSGGEKKVDLPVKSDFTAGPEWNGWSEPTYSNGSWKQSYDVAAELMLMAAKYAKVSPELTFTLACHEPESSPAGEFLKAWADAVTIATEGAIDFDIGFYGRHSGTMAVVDDMVSGVIDFGYTLPCYFRGYFPLTNVIQNGSLGIDSAEMGSNVMWELYKNNAAIQAEYDEGEVLFLWTGTTSPLAYKAYNGIGAINSLSELRGNFRSNNGPQQMFLFDSGYSVFGCPNGDVYTNISTGILSGVVMDWNSIRGFALSDVLSHYVDTNVGSDALALMCNNDVWEIIEHLGYAEDIKAVSGDYLLNLVGIWDYWEASGRYKALMNGGTIFAPSAYLRAELEIAYENVAETWVDNNGYFASQVYTQARELAAKYK